MTLYWRIPGIRCQGVALEVHYNGANTEDQTRLWRLRGNTDETWESVDSEGVWMKAIECGADIYAMRQTVYKAVRAIIANRVFSKDSGSELEKTLEIPATASGSQTLKKLLGAKPDRPTNDHGLRSQSLNDAFRAAYHRRVLH